MKKRGRSRQEKKEKAELFYLGGEVILKPQGGGENYTDFAERGCLPGFPYPLKEGNLYARLEGGGERGVV